MTKIPALTSSSAENRGQVCAEKSPRRARAVIQGIVQGVGFRPYLYRLAGEYGLAGEVANEGRGVFLELEGPGDAVEEFFSDLIPRKPPLAHIVKVDRQEIPPTGQTEFTIIPSQSGKKATALVPPDVSLCDDCLRELLDSNDRRYRYPFINCTNCGPRYTIIQGLPYDRPKTTMSAFPMCPKCQGEYENPHDRRFHAQPNACPVCGPKVWLVDEAGGLVEGDALGKACALLNSGRILAVKGLGGFHLAADAKNKEAVLRLRKRKNREAKPLAVMVRDLTAAKKLIHMSRADEELITSPVRPIMLARMKPGHGLAPEVAPGLGRLGVMIAYTPLHHLLLKEGPEVLVMTSGNLSDEPIAVNNDDALNRLDGLADYFLLHNRDIHTRADDSVAVNVLSQPRVVRRARGYVPRPMSLAVKGPDVLALGPELKNTVCLTRVEEAFLSSHVGDLKDAETLAYYEEVLERLHSLVGAKPEALAVDLHPDYLSTRHAEKLPPMPLVKVQHHVAHGLALMAEQGIEGPAVVLAMDGSGYGPDNTVWGGEVLVISERGFARAARLSPIMLPGGDRVTREVWRCAAGLMRGAYGGGWVERLPRRFVESVPGGEKSLITLERMMARGVNSPWCSSLGRLFDAAAALAGVRMNAHYEGQAAMEFEALLDSKETGAYRLAPEQGRAWDEKEKPNDSGMIDIGSGFLAGQIIEDVNAGVEIGLMSARFHNGVVQSLASAAQAACEAAGVRRVLMSGGCFLNQVLLERLWNRLADMGLSPRAHRDIPTNDGGVSLGQALAARLALVSGDLNMWAMPRKTEEIY